MKKILLLTTASLAMLMADFTLIGEQLTPVVTETTPYVQPTSDSSTSSKYLEPITLPACDANNPEVQFIKSNADWSTINSNNKRIFCVSPGDYTALNNINLNASGTADKKRYIILNNGNDTHPGKLNKSQLANYALQFNSGASYWIVDRFSSFDKPLKRQIKFLGGATHNIINRAFTSNIDNAIYITHQAHNNTIQNSRIQDQSDAGKASDSDGIVIMGWNLYDVEILNVKIINNEFKNYNHHIQFVRFDNPDGNFQNANYAGAIIDSNNFYNDTSIRTDCAGNLDPNGNCDRAETILGFKAGSDDINNPIIVSNNHFSGTRWGDKYNPDGSLSNRSTSMGCLIAYIGVKNLKILDNVFFDAANAIKLADRYSFSWGTQNTEVKRNLFYDIGSFTGRSNVPAFWMNQGKDLVASENVFINGRESYAYFIYNGSNIYFGNNDIINPGAALVDISNGTLLGIDTNRIYASSAEAGYNKDYIFTMDKFTNNPRVINLPNAMK